MSERVAIVGAGLSGSLLACMLGKRGFHVDVYERRGDPRARGFIGGRSINLALSTRGLNALERVGMADRVLAEAIPMRGRMMHSASGDLTFQPYSKDPSDAINSVSRGGLNLQLLEAAGEHENVSLHFDAPCVDLDLDRPALSFANGDGTTRDVETDVIVGADGAFSAVRGRLQRTDRFDYRQDYLEHGYKELTIPPRDGDFAMEPNALHIWPRGGSMMIALPNTDRTFTCTLFWPFAAFERLDSPDAIRQHFETNYRDAVPLMPTLVEDFQTNPTSSLVTVRCHPWHRDGRVVVIGDAAHAIVPFYGQGMNAAFEDCAVLDDCIDGYGPGWAPVLDEFTRRRKTNADAIADLALRNFIEMRDKVGSRSFLLWKKIETTLHRLLPTTFTPLYNMVSFSNIPYAEAVTRARAQHHAIVAGLCIAGAMIVLVVLLLLRAVLG